MENLWELSIEIIEKFGNELHAFYDQFKACFTTKTRDVSHHGVIGLKE